MSETGRGLTTREDAAMTPTEAEDLAARTMAAIDDFLWAGRVTESWTTAHREQAESDLAGLRDHREHSFRRGTCARCQGTFAWPCHDARRYSDGLRRVAGLYGVGS